MTAFWASEAIRISDAVCFDVKANHAVVLGLYIGKGEVAADHQLSPADARAIATALNTAADACERANGGA